ncbi:DUF1850 domain-containing protein [Pseudomonas putida]|jgi:hypothetical protein|uniref:DUF1850 domain-containing protein n=1 Tax=Pseudomonas TaxID=286 RepID=UPI0003AF1053|nr:MULTISPECIES: DUF1850 domain-containing protein [Pseudomonas]EKT4457244.1 DUF1850 domain-containing protein [Pseudomonas putida]EKT4470303.1 DUF1850 domain-containing protein [Pseudomonas putida]EKT4494298.1 DUF1850 domain-containing protein [Pseudomonas putida]EKT4514187.1 DUF1850 domain-containing protein [Pseudomonas putida]EKT4529826.1 DUF1850 domain-containing protein [Pseudomonas putida]
MISLCVGLAGVVWVSLPLHEFTLAWQHSIEKVRWEEDYQVTPAGLVLVEARVKGSGAGMEIPDDAQLRNGTWHYRRHLPPLQPLHAGRTPEAGDYQVCTTTGCQPLSHWLGPPSERIAAVDFWACENPPLDSRRTALP